MARVRVIGAGVIGLSCAVRLFEAGHEVTVLTEQDPQQTTSRVAGALWYPYLAAPVDRVTAWGVQTLRELVRLSEAEPESGVHLVDGTEVGVGELPDPAWAADVLDFRRVAGRDGEPGGAGPSPRPWRT
ncbi:FAD-dependent oxidoreductase [Micrococcus lylae]|uniref:FAD-dependent oxidoreductase n=1 Tax=Micrococcus lylae TaxID=1273 RepID=UPI003EC114A7